ncbi:MAG: HD domain-containing protein [Parcubacteria group bacterium]|nr:HD domain-containing protein [Parcubacteria group bacterium]
MKYTPRLEEAIKTATNLHRNQRRKSGKDLPYVSHLFSVAIILSEYTEDENVIIAGLLHDALEDTEYTAEQLEENFGTRVKEIVLDVSETNVEDGEPVQWKERKTAYIEHLKVASEEALLVSVADKIHNLRSILDGLEEFGMEFLSTFSTGPELQLWYNESVYGILKERSKSDMVRLYGELIEKAKIAFK